MPLHDSDQLISIVDEIRARGQESGTVEVKIGLNEPSEIGQYISALSNSAALSSEPFGFMVWGLEDATLEVIGTSFSGSSQTRV